MSQNQASTGKKETPPVSSKEEEKAIDNEDTQQIPEKSQSISQEKDQQAEEQSQEMSKEQSKEQPKEQFKEKLYEQPKEKPEEQSKEKLQEQPKEPELQTKEKEESAQDKEVQEAQKLKQENIKPEPQKLDTKQEAKQADTQLNYQQANDKTQINQAVQKENKHVENAQSKVEEQPTSSQKNQSSLEIGSQLIKEKSPQQPIQTMQREGGSSQDYLQPVFKKINQNRDYSLDSQQIVLLSKQLGTNITNEDIKKFIKQTDENKNNKIEFNEFTKWWKMNSQKNDKLTAFVNLQDKALGGFKQISQKLSSKENSNDISKEADKLNLSIQYGDGTANNSIKFEFSFAGVKVEEHIKQNNDLNLNKFHRKIHFLIEIESTDVQKCQKQFQTALKRIKESTQDHNEILKIMDIEVVTNKTSVLAEFTSTHLDTSFKDLLQHMRKTQTDHGKHIFINLESEFTFKGQLNGKEESIFVQWLCEGFIAKLKVQGNTQVLQIIRKLVEGKVPHSLFSLLTLFKSSNVNLKLKSHQNVKGFFKKLGILELSQQTPLMKDMLFDLGSMLKEGQEAQDGKFRFLFKLCKEACSLGSHKMASKIKALRSKIDARDKLRTGYGVWYVTHDKNDISYGVCTDQGYPERHAYGLIQKIKQKIEEINHCEYQTQENIKAFTKKTVNELATKYNDLSKIDKIAKANSQVKQLEKDLGDGIQKLVRNQEGLSEMEDKAEKMKFHANQFHHNADALERLMYWRNIKIKIIIALCVIGLIGFIVMIIVLKVRQT